MRRPCPLQPLQQRQQLLFQARDPIAKIAIIIEAQQALGFFLRQQLADPRRYPLARMRNEQPQRAAVDGHEFDIANHQPMPPAERLDRAQGVIAEMLVIDGVELELGDEVADVGRLDDGNALGLEHLLDPADESVGVGNMREDIVGVEDVGTLALRPPAAGPCSSSKNSTSVGMPLVLIASSAMLAAGSMPRTGMPRSL